MMMIFCLKYIGKFIHIKIGEKMIQNVNLELNKTNAQYNNVWVWLTLNKDINKINEKLEIPTNENEFYDCILSDYHIDIFWEYEIETNDQHTGFSLYPVIKQIDLKYDVYIEYKNDRQGDVIQNEIIFNQNQIQTKLLIDETNDQGININIDNIKYDENDLNNITIEWKLV